MSKRNTQIQMRESKYRELNSDRAMMNKLIPNQRGSPNQQSNLINKSYIINEQYSPPQKPPKKSKSSPNKHIFDNDFPVDQMYNPDKYLPSYNQNNNTDNCMADVYSCCGQIAIFCGCFFAPCCAKCCVYELETSSAGLVQRFGKFSRLLKPGFNRLNPCSEQVQIVDMKIRILNTGHHPVITKDNVKLTIQTSFAFRVTNPIIVHYKLGNELNKAVNEIVISSFRKIIGMHFLQNVITDRSLIVEEVLDEICKNLIQGILIQRVFLEDVKLPHEIERDLSSVARTKRTSEANIIQSKADVQSAQLMRQSAQLLDTKAAMQIRYLQLVQDLGRRGSTLVMDIGAQKNMQSLGYRSKQA